jgi:putative oxidoreductase
MAADSFAAASMSPDEPLSARLAYSSNAMRYVVPVGRVLFAAIFIMSSFSHFKQATIAEAATHGVPLADIAVPLSGILALVGGLSVAFGYQARLGAWMLVLFLVPVTLSMHNFWAYADPQMRIMQQVHFMKNLAMLGAALFLTYDGAGPISLDAARAKKVATV